MAVKLPWGEWSEVNGRWPAPGPDDEILAGEPEPCPPDVGDLPPPIAAACAAALDAAACARALVLTMTDLLPSRPADDRRIVFVPLWWQAVAGAGRAKGPIFAAARWLNKGRPPVTAMGVPGLSFHHVALEYALLHTRSMYHVAEVTHHPEKATLLDPTAVYRQPAPRGRTAEHPNQVIQDIMLARLDFLIAYYRQKKFPTDLTRSEALILAEARDAADSYRNDRGRPGRPRSDLKEKVTDRVTGLRSVGVSWKEVKNRINTEFGTAYEQGTLEDYARKRRGK